MTGEYNFIPTQPAEAIRLRLPDATTCGVDQLRSKRLETEDRLNLVEREASTDAARSQQIRSQAKTANHETAIALAAEARGIELRAPGIASRRRELLTEIEMVDREIQAAKDNGHAALRRAEHAQAIAAQCLLDIATREDEIRRLQRTAEGQTRVAKIALGEALDVFGTATPPITEADNLAKVLARHDEERGR